MLAAAALLAGCTGGDEDASPTVTATPPPTQEGGAAVARWRAHANGVCRDLDRQIRELGTPDLGDQDAVFEFGGKVARLQLAARRRLGRLDAPPSVRDDVRALLSSLDVVDRELETLRTAKGDAATKAIERLEQASNRATRLMAELGLANCPIA